MVTMAGTPAQHVADSTPSAGGWPDREWPAVWLSLAMSIATYVLVASVLGHMLPADGEVAAADASLLGGDAFLPMVAPMLWPEPLEKARYLLGLLCIPTLPTALYALLRRLITPGVFAALSRAASLLIRDAALAVLLAAWLGRIAVSSRVPNMALLLLTAFIVAGLLLSLRERLPRLPSYAAWCIISLLAAVHFSTQLVGDHWFARSAHISHHTDLLLGAVNQAAHGKTPLVDCSSQYGLLYPLVAAAALAPCGVSIQSLTIFFALLSVAQAGLLLRAVSRQPGTTPSWQAAFALVYAGFAAPGLATAWFNAYHRFFVRDFRQSGVAAVYFQHDPIRTFWFAVFVWLTAPHGLPLTGWTIPLGYALAATSVLWNADSGLVILVAWTGMLVFRRLAGWRSEPWQVVRYAVAQCAAAAGALGVALFVYAVLAVWRSGRWPRFDELLRYQRIFYEAGFMMLPMRLWEFWQPVVAIFALTIAACMRQVVDGRLAADASWRFFIAAYGLGTFSYFQGRSHPECLSATFLPAVMLAFLGTRHAYAALAGLPASAWRASPRLRSAVVAAICLSAFCVCGFVNLCRGLPAAVRYCFDTTGGLAQIPLEPVWQQLRPHVAGKPVVILAEPSAYLHTRTGSWSQLPVSSPTEVFLESQLAAIQQALEPSDTILVVNPKLQPPWTQLLDLGGFEPVAELPMGYSLLKRRKP
jgi:hypothetical protein